MELSEVAVRWLVRVALNSGRVSAVDGADHRATIELLQHRGLVRWGARDGFTTDLVHITPAGRRHLDAIGRDSR